MLNGHSKIMYRKQNILVRKPKSDYTQIVVTYRTKSN
nr:hypothetical protein CoNPh38_CDS0210 [Staphylococcus phage S-CoN_Ph38]